MKAICNSLDFSIQKKVRYKSIEHALDTNKIYRIETC